MLIASFSGIRGIYGKDLTEDVARRFCFCYSKLIGKSCPKIVIGTDTRQSRDRLKQAVFDSVDADFIDVGIAPIPVVELAVREYKADGGIMITASHNEPEYNGFKFLDKDGAVLREKDINNVISDFRKIESLSEEDFLNDYLYKGKGNESVRIKKVIKKGKDILERYCRFLYKIMDKKRFDKKLRILIDPNGGAGIVAEDILERFGVEVVSMNDKPGEFRRTIEPNEESLAYLRKKAAGFSFAAGFDCDADRVEIVLPDGALVDGNYILALCIRAMDAKKVVVNDATSGLIREIATDVIETETGEINVVDKMYEEKAAIGGEGSNGGVIIPPSRCRDGILTLLIIIKLITDKNKPLKEIIDELPRYCTKADKIKGVDFDKLKDNIINHYKKEGYYIKKQKTSIKAVKEDSFIWFRQSKTEHNIVRVIADSKDEKESEELLARGLRMIRSNWRAN